MIKLRNLTINDFLGIGSDRTVRDTLTLEDLAMIHGGEISSGDAAAVVCAGGGLVGLISPPLGAGICAGAVGEHIYQTYYADPPTPPTSIPHPHAPPPPPPPPDVPDAPPPSPELPSYPPSDGTPPEFPSVGPDGTIYMDPLIVTGGGGQY